MHHITYKDYAGIEKLVKFSAAELVKVLFFVGSLQRASMEYTHVFWD